MNQKVSERDEKKNGDPMATKKKEKWGAQSVRK